MTFTTDGGLAVDPGLHSFISDELAGEEISAETVYRTLDATVQALADRNADLLRTREELQARIDGYWQGGGTVAGQRAFLRDIGYLQPTPEGVQITVDEVDPEIATVAAPQLVVPLDNARYALNAANARWGSLYDALYGTDVIGPPPAPGSPYDPARGRQVVAWTQDLLDTHLPLDSGSHAEARRYAVVAGALIIDRGEGQTAGLADPAALVAYSGPPDDPSAVLLRHHRLGVELRLDRDHPIGAEHPAGLADVLLEAALTTIMDAEDSVASVDGSDKVTVYRNWLGLCRGDLTAAFHKRGQPLTRRLATDRVMTGPDGGEVTVPARSLMLIRNVGHHLLTDAVTRDGEPIPETILDAVITVAAAAPYRHRTSRHGSIYVVKPKLHGPDEVRLAVELMRLVEQHLELPERTVKIGIMDEERRTSANLAACIEAARDRVVFVNTGFLDRTGDEIHTSMAAGPTQGRQAIANSPWLTAYEHANVATALRAGFAGRAQIGKGMWARPDAMAEMLRTKGSQPAAGASTAWVPSPTAATLHAVHYHRVDVAAVQADPALTAADDLLDRLLIPPVVVGAPDADVVDHDLEESCQSILGYVARWVGRGVGCSTVPNLQGVGLMEDLATLRISSQLLASWLHHGVIDEDGLRAAMGRMAAVVDEQQGQTGTSLALTGDGPGRWGLEASIELVLGGRLRPNGYTESVLTRFRRQVKAELQLT